MSVPESSDRPVEPLVDAEHIAAKCLGLAVTVAIPARFTWVLTERFGKQLSVYNGAVRIYLPGFAEDADPYEHKIILAERLLVTEGTRRVSGDLRHIAAAESRRRLRLGQHVLSFADVREKSEDSRLARLQEEQASESVQLDVAQQQIQMLKLSLRKAEEDLQWFSDEHSQAEVRANAAESDVQRLSYRVQQLKGQLEDRDESPDSNIPLPTAWCEFASWCEENLSPRVLLSPRARREVKDAQFGDVEVAARCVRWLANDYYDRRRSGGDGDLRLSVEQGIQNDQCGADTFSFKWQGKHRNVRWHIKNGGNTRDPRRCLRIYYFWDDTRRQVVVVSLPAHVRTDAT